jgi:hypothetical protein
VLLSYNPVKLVEAYAKHLSVCLVKVISEANKGNCANVNRIGLFTGKERLFLVQ